MMETVDLIIPVYRGPAELRKCLESVFRHRQQTPFEVILVDDASPEAAVRELVREYAKRPDTHVLTNSENAGFVASVNRASELHPARDMLLLNSDTEVHGDWLDRISTCARKSPKTATVTPFSNNATICSYPVPLSDNVLPQGTDPAMLDDWFKSSNFGQYEIIPTAVGFCMYVDREAWRTLGGFDEDRFGRGYGEENDFSRRAVAANRDNLVCADTFVYHKGGVSFGTDSVALQAAGLDALLALHPDYEIIIREFAIHDPLHRFRCAVDETRLHHGQALQLLEERNRERQIRSRLYRVLEQQLLELLTTAVRTEQFVRDREQDVAILRQALSEEQAARSQALSRIAELEKVLNDIHSSRIWRYSRPLRKLGIA